MSSIVLVLSALFFIMILLSGIIVELLKIRRTLESIERSGQLSAGLHPDTGKPSKQKVQQLSV